MKNKRFNKCIAVILIGIICFSVTGCGKQEKALFHVCGYDLSYEQTLVFGYIYGMNYNLKASDDFKADYEGGLNYGDYCKEQIQNDIIETLLLWNEAKDNKIKLSSEEKQQVSDNVKKLTEYFGSGRFEGADISQKDIETVYEMKALADAYVKQLTDDKQSDEASDTYVKVYQVTFLTAKLDANGNYTLDEDGNVIMEDSATASKMKEAAQTVSSRVQDGEDIKEVIKDYDASVTGAEKYLKVKDLPSAYRKEIEGMSVGDTSNPIGFDYGYYVVELLSEDGEDYAKAVANHEYATESEEKRTREIDRLKDKYIGTSTDYVEKNWSDIKIENFTPS